MEKIMLYIVQVTLLTINPNQQGRQECINFPIDCWTYDVGVMRMNFINRGEAYLTYYVAQKDTLFKNTFTASIPTFVHIDSVLIDEDKAEYWLSKSGEFRNQNK